MNSTTLRCLSSAVCLAAASAVQAQNQPPQIQNLNATYMATSGNLNITYDLTDAEADSVQVSLKVSNNAGQTFTVGTSGAAGAIGFPVMPGTGKMVTLALGALSGPAADYRVRLVADDRKPVNIQQIVNQVDSMRMKDDLKNIIEGFRNPMAAMAHWQDLKDTIQQRFVQAQLTATRQPFTYQTYTGHNIIGRKNGITDDTRSWIVDAHFDAVVPSPGADDNGSGVAGLLEAARILSQYEYDQSLRFIGFDLEEWGYLGSKYYVNNGGIPAWETVRGVYNFEMIGYYTEQANTQTVPPGFNLLFGPQYAMLQADSFRGNFIANIANTASDTLRTTYDNAVAMYVPGFKSISVALPGAGTIAPDFRRSDHSSFWDANIPAIMLTDGSEFRNQSYHTGNDVSDSLNFTFMSNTVKATVGAVAHLAGIRHATSRTVNMAILTGVGTTGSGTASFTLTPNPATNQVTLAVQNATGQPLQLVVTDLSGKKLLEEELRGAVVRHNLSVAGFAPGVYFISLGNGSARMASRFVKQ